MNNAIASIVIILVAVGAAFAVFYFSEKKEIRDLDNELRELGESTQEVKKFSSARELSDFLRSVQAQQSFRSVETFAAGVDIPAPTLVGGVAESAQKADASQEFSQTNIQVQGVDEADFVKNDGKYIYMLSGNKLVIVDAYPGEQAKIISETAIEGSPRDLFLNKENLIIFLNSYEIAYEIPEFDYLPRQQYKSVTRVLIYDVTNKESPKLMKNYSISGNYYESRMIDNVVYVIAQDPVGYDVPILPMVKESGKVIASPEVYYFDNPEINYVFNVIASFKADGRGEVNAKTFMLGYANTLYVSQENIYLAYQKNLPYVAWEKERELRFYQVIVPLLPEIVQDEINTIRRSELSSGEKWDKVRIVLENMYNNMGEEEKKELQKKIQDALEEYEAKLEAERRKTVIHKISINDGDIEYKKRGEVNGYLLNQFSLDEYEGNLRIATTTYIYRRDSTMYNNVYILDGDLDIKGKVEDIAPDERIYSTRFINDRLYMVTFKRIDPFFVISLDPQNPKILGELKIPGFSDYLHPYDENFVIGIGKETEGNEWGGVSVGGLKLALFDVRDVANPKEVGKYIIGRQGTDSEALYEHKAFLFDKKKNLLVIPAREVAERVYDDKRGYYRWRTWQGAYVFTLTSEEGFALRGKISHGQENEVSEYYYGGASTAVRRSLFMDDYLYTVSQKKVKVNDMNTIEEIKEIELPFTQDIYPRPYPPIIIDEGGIDVSGSTDVAIDEAA